jgi:methylthioribulose-1-phosphate dehydratase
MSIDPKRFPELEIQLLEVIRQFHQYKWALATATNYSFRHPEPGYLTISSSGIDKSKFMVSDFMIIDYQGQPAPGYRHLKPSAETGLHCMLYENPAVESVLHTHSVPATVLSLRYAHEKAITLTDFEMLKALPGIETHQTAVSIPIFNNNQNISLLAAEIRNYLLANPHMPAFLIAGHGLYGRGNSIAEAKKVIESLEFMFECLLWQMTLQK